MYYNLFAGTYAPADQAGLHLLRFDSDSGTLAYLQGMEGIARPSFLALHPSKHVVYAVSEVEDGAIVAVRYDPDTGAMKEINRQQTLGVWPCHLRVGSDGQWLYAVNYGSGSVCLFPLREDGSIGELADLVQHEGRSIRDDRQKSPHPHSIWSLPGTCDRFWLVPDLGTDRLYVYCHDKAATKLKLVNIIPCTAGSGPRHAAYHPVQPYLYVIEELSSTITAYEFDPASGQISTLQAGVSTLPSDFSGESTCADIHVTLDGKFLYGSNRGHDSIASFRILGDGCLEAIGHFATQGRTPRNFTLIDREPYLLVANQDSNSIALFRLTEAGLIVATDAKLVVTNPVCLQVKRI